MTTIECPHCHEPLPVTNDAFCTFGQEPLDYCDKPQSELGAEVVARQSEPTVKDIKEKDPISDWDRFVRSVFLVPIAVFLVPIGLFAFYYLLDFLVSSFDDSAFEVVGLLAFVMSLALAMYLFWRTTSGFNYGWRVVICLAYFPILLWWLFNLLWIAAMSGA